MENYQYGFSRRFKTHSTSFVAKENASTTVKIAGWVHIKRHKGKLMFLH